MKTDKKKVIYACHQPTHLALADYMQKELNWEPVFWYSSPDVEEELKNKYPNAFIQDYYDSIKGVVPPQCKSIPEAIVDETLLKKMSFHESVSLLMMDRIDLTGTLTFKDRWNLYISQLAYWKGVLDYLKPDYVILESTPHETCDYILYALCQEFGIKTILYNYTLYYDRIFAFDSIDSGSVIIRDSYYDKLNKWDGKEITLSGKPEEILQKNLGKYDPNLKPYILPYLNKFQSILKENIYTKIQAFVITNIKRIFRLHAIKTLFKIIADRNKPSVHNYQKQKGKPIGESQLTNWEFNYYTQKAARHKKHLYRFYASLCNKNIDLDQPFIYFPLHYQPEETTSPLGGYFVDQLLIIDTLSKSVPAGWKIYVKEHFSQFVYSMWGEVTRSEEYYKKIASYPNVELVPMDIDSFTLIDKCKCTATVTGAVSFETVCRGKPVILFGHAVMYKYCEGMFYAPNKEDVADFMKLVQMGFKPDLNKIKLWLQTMYEHTFRGGIGTAYNYGKMDIYKEENTESHIKATFELLNFYEQKKNITAESSANTEKVQ